MIPGGQIRRFQVQAYQAKGQASQKREQVACEEPLEIRLVTGPKGRPQTRPFVMTMRTPGNDFALAAGLLYAEGVIQKAQDIVKMSWCTPPKEEQRYNILKIRLAPDLQPQWERYARHTLANSSCGLCGKTTIEQLKTQIFPDFGSDSPRLTPAWIYTLSTDLRQYQKVFAKTGGIHAAALYHPQGQHISLQEDVGRHNALDKLIGEQLLAGRLPLLNQVLVVSGRTSYELIQKALRASIPVVIGVGAPSSLAVELAQSYGVTLIGFASETRFNVYSGEQRLQSVSNP